MTDRKITCAICGENIDPSACGQVLARLTIEDDSVHETTGKTERARFILCEDHSLELRIWIHEQQIKNTEKLILLQR